MKKLLGFLAVVNGILLVLLTIDFPGSDSNMVSRDVSGRRAEPSGGVATREMSESDPSRSLNDEMESKGTEAPVASPMAAAESTGGSSIVKRISHPPAATAEYPAASNVGAFVSEAMNVSDEEPLVTGGSAWIPNHSVNPNGSILSRLPIVLLENRTVDGIYQSVDDRASSSNGQAKEGGLDGDPILAELERKFVDDIGGPNQDPTSPDYARLWQQALLDSNQRFKALYGKDAYLRNDIAAAQEAFNATAQ